MPFDVNILDRAAALYDAPLARVQA